MHVFRLLVPSPTVTQSHVRSRVWTFYVQEGVKSSRFLSVARTRMLENEISSRRFRWPSQDTDVFRGHDLNSQSHIPH